MDSVKQMAITLSRTDISENDKEFMLRHWTDEVLHAAKNIRETSFSEADKQARAIELEKTKGIPKTYLI